jgi:N4-gp56 family major capsid protein
MAQWTVTASTPIEAEAAQFHAMKLNREAPYGGFFDKFTGKGQNNIIELKDEFIKNKGDAINFGLIADLSQVIHNEGYHEDNEESKSTYWDSVVLDEIGDAVRIPGDLTEQRASYDMREAAKESAKIWINEQVDRLMFKKLSGSNYQAYPGTAKGTLGSLETACGSATANSNILYGGDATATTELEESDEFTLDLIDDAVTCAEMGVIGSTSIYRMRPIMHNNGLFYICVISPYQKNSLRKNSDYKSLMKEAEVRGKENPLFTGADFFYNKTFIYSNRLVETSTTWGADSNVNGATALFMGAQAGLLGIATKAWNWNEYTVDAGRKWGLSWSRVLGFDKATFNSIDFSVIAIKTAAKNPQL